jgi:hypothetical protein
MYGKHFRCFKLGGEAFVDSMHLAKEKQLNLLNEAKHKSQHQSDMLLAVD